MHPGLGLRQAVTAVENALAETGEPGLLIRYAGLAKGVLGAVSVKTFVDPEPKGQKGTSYFEVIASPSLYATQLDPCPCRGRRQRTLTSVFLSIITTKATSWRRYTVESIHSSWATMTWNG